MSKSVLPSPGQTRLVTIIAHVDHGKTTLADNLLSSNNIISENLAGTIRFLDSLLDEQRRGITMKGKAIALKHTKKQAKKKKNNAEDNNNSMVIHLIDSPGHVDFSVEVTTSLLLCDGALLIIDVVEGMCARTHAVMREAYMHELTPILVLNKLDKLCLELHLSPNEAYARTKSLIESVNAASAAMVMRAATERENFGTDIGELSTEKELEMWNFDPCKGNVLFVSAFHGWGLSIPALAKSLFQSKTVPIKPILMRQYLFGDFRYRSDTNKITKFTPNSASNVNFTSMFVEFGLKPIWDIYEGITESSQSIAGKSTKKITIHSPGMAQVLESLQVGFSNFTNNDKKEYVQNEFETILKKAGGNISSSNKEEALLRSILRRYRPLSDALLDAVCDHCPSPDCSQKERKALHLKSLPTSVKENINFSQSYLQIQNAALECNQSRESPVLAQVCKFIATNTMSIQDPELTNSFPENDDVKKSNKIMGLARVLSGTLVSNESYFLFGPKYSPSSQTSLIKQTIKLYIVMGASFIRVNHVPAGHLCAIYHLEEYQYKSITISDTDTGCMPLQGFDGELSLLRPLIKVHIEPMKVADIRALEVGLQKLSLADSSIEITTTSNGEQILACLGELHLEQSLIDLKTMYCPSPDIDFRISDPIVDFGETCHWFPNETTTDFSSFYEDSLNSQPLRQVSLPPYVDEEGILNAKGGRTRMYLGARGAAISARVVPLSPTVYQCIKEKRVIEECVDDLLALGKALNFIDIERNETANPDEILKGLLDSAIAFCDAGNNAMVETTTMTNGQTIKGILMEDDGQVFIPKKETSAPPADTFEQGVKQTNNAEDVYHSMKNTIQQYGCISSNPISKLENRNISDEVDESALNIWKTELRGSAVGGFQLATRAGPLCEEPIRNCLIILEGLEIAMKRAPNPQKKYISVKQISGGMVVASLRSAIRCAFLTRPVRLMEQHLKLTLHSSVAGLGALYAVLSKRRGRVTKDSVVDGTDLLLIEAYLPQAESFRLSSDLLDKSSGEVTAPELVFSHWEVLDEDPFWVPTSFEEREDYGEIVATRDSAFSSTGVSNNALRYIRMVRNRKGLRTDSSKIVVAAEKQRTLARKK